VTAEGRAATFFLAPALLLTLFFFFAPVVAGFALSLTDFDLYSIGDIHNLRFVALHNYRELLGSNIFWQAFFNTILFAVIGGPLTVLASLVSALLLNAKLTRWKALFRTIYFAPVVTTLVAVSIVFKYLYHPRFGVINRALGTLGIPAIDWLGDTHWALFSIIILAIWRQFGYSMIIFIAGLQTIPDELHEAAATDGAGMFRRFRHITLPHLRGVIIAITSLDLVWNFNSFGLVYVLTEGGPGGKTQLPSLFAYNEAFKYGQFGYASALGDAMVVVIACFLVFYLWAGGRQRHA